MRLLTLAVLFTAAAAASARNRGLQVINQTQTTNFSIASTALYDGNVDVPERG